jgi:hypothetical protein
MLHETLRGVDCRASLTLYVGNSVLADPNHTQMKFFRGEKLDVIMKENNAGVASSTAEKLMRRSSLYKTWGRRSSTYPHVPLFKTIPLGVKQILHVAVLFMTFLRLAISTMRIS